MNKKLMNSLIIITIIDLIIVGIYMIGIITISLENKYDNTDVNKDGETNALDLLIVQKEILKKMENK